MKLWFDDHMRTYLDWDQSLRCDTLRHEKDNERGCTGWFKPFLGGRGKRICLCWCHSAAIARRAPVKVASGPLDLRPFVGGVTMTEAGENLARSVRALRAARDEEATDA